MLYRHAALIGRIFSPEEKIPYRWDAFPEFWTQEERAELTQQSEMEKLKEVLWALAPSTAQEG